MFFDFVNRGPLRDPDPAALPGVDPPAVPPVFDPAAFKTELLAEFRKDLGGVTRAFKAEMLKLVPVPPAVPPPPPDPADPPLAKTPAENALALELNYRTSSEARIKALETTNLETAKGAEKTDRESRIRSELAKYQFANDKARETAFRLFNSEVTRGDDGALVANELPFDKFIETELPANHSYLLAPKDLGGADLRRGKSAGGKKWDLERDLLPVNFAKLTPQEQVELRRFVETAP